MLAIVLKRRNFREYDQLISLFTKEGGKKETLAKGVKKIVSKQAGYLEPFSVVEVEIIKGKELEHLTKVLVKNIFKKIRNNLQKSLLASQAIRLVDKITVLGEKDEKIFNLTSNWLEYLENVVKEIGLGENLLYSFIIKLLDNLGLAPELEKCVICGGTREKIVGFDISNGGVYCTSCQRQVIKNEHVFSISVVELDFIKMLLNDDWEEVIEIEGTAKIFEIINKFLRFHCGYNFTFYKLNVN